MPGHETLTNFAIVAMAALACGMVLSRLRQPAVVGYILAGALLGPSALGLVENRAQVQTLAELGVLMLLFLVGMELSLRGFKAVWRLAVMATLLQIGGGIAVMLLLSRLFGWSLELAVLLGFVVALSSTAVTVKMLQEIGELRSTVGRVTVGVLIAQDLAVVPMMIVTDSMAGGSFGRVALVKVVLSVAFLALLILYLSRRQRVQLPLWRFVEGNADLLPLAGLVFCFGAAAISGLMGLSPAYGAFIAGLVLGNSTARPRMIESMGPIQSVLMMVFFLSVGLLIDLRFLWDNLGVVLVLLLIVTVVKTAFNVGALRLLDENWPRAFLCGVLLAQIGEFSFLLAAIGQRNGVIGDYNHGLVVAVTALSLVASPFWLETARRLHRVALPGIVSAGELLRILYGGETRALVDLSRRLGRHAAAEVRDLAAALRPRRGDAARRTAPGTTDPADPAKPPETTGGGPADA